MGAIQFCAKKGAEGIWAIDTGRMAKKTEGNLNHGLRLKCFTNKAVGPYRVQEIQAFTYYYPPSSKQSAAHY